MTGWLIQLADHHEILSLWVQGYTDHHDAVRYAASLLPDQRPVGWIRVVNGKPGPRHFV